jgi:hypothetical protein
MSGQTSQVKQCRKCGTPKFGKDRCANPDCEVTQTRLMPHRLTGSARSIITVRGSHGFHEMQAGISKSQAWNFWAR